MDEYYHPTDWITLLCGCLAIGTGIAVVVKFAVERVIEGYFPESEDEEE